MEYSGIAREMWGGKAEEIQLELVRLCVFSVKGLAGTVALWFLFLLETAYLP